MDYKKLADLVYPDLQHDCDYYENLFPQRDLPKGAQVLRTAPSPTGFIHLGNLYGAYAAERIAHQSDGVFYLRIEDTDLKRKVEGAVETIISVFKYFEINFDEGAQQGGNYGPYYQRQRAEIYHTFAKKLIAQGDAYPCFCSEAELNEIREQQTALKQGTGYYGQWAKCRNLSYEEVKKHIDNGDPFVVRLRATGDPSIKHSFHDEIKGDIVVTENNQDIVLIKTDGIPTYHFAHAIDDHLMRTTIVSRGEEWLGSLPIHLELFKKLGFELPKYAHTTQLMKIDNGVRRKLSKRKDPELSLDFYRQLGYHPYAVKIYLLTILNWNFEQWYLKNPDTPIDQFKFSLDKMGQSGTLFDLEKLNNISKTYLSKFSLEEMKDFIREFVKAYHPEREEIYFADQEKLDKILTLGMGLNQKKRRKDYIYASQILEKIDFYFDEFYHLEDQFECDDPTVVSILEDFLKSYDFADDNNTWFEKLKVISDRHGFASDLKDYRDNPDNYKGSISDVAEIVRIAATGYKNTPDLWSIMQIIGEQATRSRIQKTIDERK